VEVTAMTCDISKPVELRKALNDHARERRPPIKGIIHGGMDLKVRSSIILGMTAC